MKPYNGHKSYNYWNVALWLFNDEHFYGIVRQAFRDMKSRPRRNLTEATHWVWRRLQVDLRTTEPHTPDGVPFLKTYIREALKGYED